MRWAPDGRQVLLVAPSIVRCVVEPTVRCAPAAGARRAATEFGASWSPDSTRFAYVRGHRADDTPGTDLGDLVTVPADGAGATTVVEHGVFGKRRWTYPVPPVWTRAGLAFTVYSQPAPRRGSEDITEAGYPDRIRTRIVGPDGRVRTLTAATPGGEGTLPFLASSDSPSGRLLGAEVTAERAEPYTPRYTLRTLGGDGVLAPYGVSFTFPAAGRRDVLGVLADGRVALRTDHGRGARPATLSLVVPGVAGTGAPVARGGTVSAAVAYPNDARGF